MDHLTFSGSTPRKYSASRNEVAQGTSRTRGRELLPVVFEGVYLPSQGPLDSLICDVTRLPFADQPNSKTHGQSPLQHHRHQKTHQLPISPIHFIPR